MKKILLLSTLFVSMFLLVACNFGANDPVGLMIELPTKTEYVIGETFDKSGLKVSLFVKSGEVKELAEANYNLTGTNLSRLGTHTIRVSHKTVDAEFTVYVKENPEKVLLASISNYPETVFYQTVPTGTTVELDGLDISLLKVNGTSTLANLSDFTATVVDTQMTDGDYKVYVVNMSHKTLEGVQTGFLIYVLNVS